MGTILSYPNRGKWGNWSYRGNVTGHLIKYLLNKYQPKKFLEVFSGGGTGKDVANHLNITNSIHLDLNNGWNALTDDIPTGSDLTFSHPPYWDIISYQQYNGNHPDDLSLNMSYEEFIQKLNKVNAKIYQSLVNHGRHAFLVGDCKKKGKYYSIIKDMAYIGDLEIHRIKAQHNTQSEGKRYKAFDDDDRITHEHLLVFRKNNIWTVPITLTKTIQYDLRATESMTWRDLIQGALQSLGGKADLPAIYQIIASTKKASMNNHWKEKVRQTLYINPNFKSEKRGWWELEVI